MAARRASVAISPNLENVPMTTRLKTKNAPPPAQGLYHPAQEHDACGIGFVANIRGQKSHEIISKGIKVLLNLT
ncbi:MAG: hypothetical protein WCA47_05470, partial [Terriglobales bacterium]